MKKDNHTNYMTYLLLVLLVVMLYSVLALRRLRSGPGYGPVKTVDDDKSYRAMLEEDERTDLYSPSPAEMSEYMTALLGSTEES